MKKIKLPERKAGIWLDQEKAYIISIVGIAEPVVEKITSGVESVIRNAGERKVYARFGNAFIDDQEKKQRRQKNQRLKYFKKIIEKILDTDFIYLFGPSDAKHELNNEIEKTHTFKGLVATIESADRMTENELKKKVIHFFETDNFRAFKRNLEKQKILN
jgi:lysyl-tRNA synthetase class I